MAVIYAWWHWVAVNSSTILFAIYLASVVCFVVLTVWVLTLARRMAKHLRSGGEKAALIAKLGNTIHEQALTLEALNARIGQTEGSWEKFGAVARGSEQAALVDSLATALTEQARRIDILSERIGKADRAPGSNGTGAPTLSPALRDEILSLVHDMAADDRAEAAAPGQLNPEANS